MGWLCDVFCVLKFVCLIGCVMVCLCWMKKLLWCVIFCWCNVWWRVRLVVGLCLWWCGGLWSLIIFGKILDCVCVWNCCVFWCGILCCWFCVILGICGGSVFFIVCCVRMMVLWCVLCWFVFNVVILIFVLVRRVVRVVWLSVGGIICVSLVIVMRLLVVGVEVDCNGCFDWFVKLWGDVSGVGWDLW